MLLHILNDRVTVQQAITIITRKEEQDDTRRSITQVL